MSKKLPYEESLDQQLNDLPLPDGEQSWQKMKQLLEDDDKGRRILPPVLLRSCAGWGALGLLLLAGAWFIIRPEKWWKNDATATNTTTTTQQEEKNKKTPDAPDNNQNQDRKEEGTKPPQTNSATGSGTAFENTTSESRQTLTGASQKEPGLPLNNQKKIGSAIAQNKKAKSGQAYIVSASTGLQKITVKNDDLSNGKKKPPLSVPAEGTDVTDIGKIPAKISSPVIAQTEVSKVSKMDSAKKTTIDSAVAVITEQAKVKKKKAQQYWLSAGVGVQQQISIGGQKPTAYNYNGEKNALADYLPSVYVRLHRGQKWFIQGEFQYGAPQSVKGFSFSQQTKYDDSSKTLVTTIGHLKKTYYHQLPLSFNYFVQPNWSVGIGGVYSRFHGAVTELETVRKDISTGAATSVKQIRPVQGFTDSFLYKTQVHILFQTDYQWKRFSFGLRYTRDLQPYIKYTRPNGEINTQKNQSLQFILRLRLWDNLH
jgi:hypothetical protein